jgi:2-polyprenyl-6-hydroxyphenyl methylase/3-demethylubiquinone-9 3-methyltransferase
MEKPAKNMSCLWYDGTAEDAARFFTPRPFLIRPSMQYTTHQGDVLTVEFTVMEIPCLGLNGEPAFKHNEAFLFQVATVDQAETDRYWNEIVGNGG